MYEHLTRAQRHRLYLCTKDDFVGGYHAYKRDSHRNKKALYQTVGDQGKKMRLPLGKNVHDS